MTQPKSPRRLTRRGFLKLGGGAVAAAAGARLLPGVVGRMLQPISQAEAQSGPYDVDLHLAATDGWIYVPGSVPNPSGPGPLLPDPMARAPQTAYAFGFRNVTLLNNGQPFSDQQVLDQKEKVQASAPLLYIDELDRVRIRLSNLGLAQRPDLTDSHTIHFHGFRNALPLFDGVPEMSIAVPIGREFPYFYHPHDAGTYMYHCHFEDVEHVSMGMTGIVFVRPAQNRGNAGLGIPASRLPNYGGPSSAPMGYVYNDGVPPGNPLSTAYDREWGMFLSELWTEERWRDAHIQENDWSDYEPDCWLLNGRTYPDTLAPNGLGADPTTGDLIAPPGRPDLQYQPISSLVTANSGDRVLLRFVNLGYQQHAMTLAGIPMKVVGRDATFMQSKIDGTDTSFSTDTVYIGPGESVDAIFVAPSVSSQTTFLLYNRNYAYLHNPGLPGLGGQMTEVRISPSGVPSQTTPNT